MNVTRQGAARDAVSVHFLLVVMSLIEMASHQPFFPFP